MSVVFIIAAIILSASGGLPGVFMSSKNPWGQRVAAVMSLLSSVFGLFGAFMVFAGGGGRELLFPWQAAGNSVIGVDSLSAFFLMPIFLMGALGSVYGLGYWPQTLHPDNGRKLRLFWGLMVSGMALLVVSKAAMAFLFGWEIMALSAFFLVTTEDDRRESCRAGWIYLAATHISTLILFALFALWRKYTGSYELKPVSQDALSLGAMNIMFFLAFVGFGIKAGVMPLHFWLPGAHANAPSHVSAMLSGVVLKMGIYGFVRFLSLLPQPPYIWGVIIMVFGVSSGILGVVFAIAQHDLKRLLAYHSVENIGIILMGLALAMLGISEGNPQWITLGMACCLLHTWNHSLFKPLLFLSGGGVVHACDTRNIDSLGGLAKLMPCTAVMFAIGAAAICGLPPLNGFVSELFVYMGLFDAAAGGNSLVCVSSVIGLAMIGALALACFVKVFAAVFLGTARSENAAGAHEASWSMRLPMIILAAVCVFIGVMPVLTQDILNAAIAVWIAPADLPLIGIQELAPVKAVSFMSVLLIITVFISAVFARLLSRPNRLANTWDCGYTLASSRIQYTASSFAQMITAMFGWVLHQKIHNPEVHGLFPKNAKMDSHVNELVLDRIILPLYSFVERLFGWFRRFQHGITQHYLIYILITVIVMMSTMIPFKEFVVSLFTR